MSHILIVGRNFSGLRDYLAKHGHSYTLLQDINATKYPDKKIKHRTLANFTSKELLLSAVDTLKVRPDAVFSIYENYVLPTAWIAEHLKLPGMPITSAEACTDKYLMRSLFDKAPEKISPAFEIVCSENDVMQFAKEHSFPLILKPANLVKSLLVTKNHNIEELIANYRKSVKLLESTYKTFAPNREPKLIIEEFLEGSIHSIDAFVDQNGEPHILEQVVDYQTGYDIGFDDNFHYSRLLPSNLSIEDSAALRHCAAVGVKALGMKNSPAHIEIIITKEGPRIVEIGARNGGYRDRMYGLANGIDITGAALATALGEKPSITATRNDGCAVLELFPKNPGYYDGISDFTKLEKLSSLNYLKIVATENKFIGKSSDGFKMAAIVILHNSDLTQLSSDLEFISKNVLVQIRN